MKRYLVFGAVLAALLIGGTSISWALDVGMSGDYRLRGFYNDNLTDGDKDAQDSAAYYSSRFMLTTKATQDGVSGVVTLLAGSTNGTGNRLLGDVPFGPDGIVPSVSNSGVITSVDILEAYIKADFKSWALTGGRAPLKFGNGVILDDWVDGIWADLGMGGATLTLGTAKIVESTDGPVVIGIGGSGPGTGGDADLYFVNAGLGDMGKASAANVFLLYLDDRSDFLFGGGAGPPADSSTTVWTLGGSADLDMNGIKLKAELDYMNGTHKPGGTAPDADIQGYNIVLGAKLGAGGIPLGFDLIYTSGQDSDPTSTDVNINGLSGNYPIGIIITNSGARSLGVTDGTCLSQNGSSTYGGGSPGCIFGSGLTAIKVSSGVTHGPHVIDVAAIWAQSTEDPIDAGAPPNATDAGSDIGIELDATLTWSLTKNLSWLVGAGYLLAGDFVQAAPTNTGASDNLVVLVTQLGYTF